MVRYADGTVHRGESVIPEMGQKVSSVSVEPEGAVAPPGVIEAIERADAIVLSSGSLFTSTIPSLLGGGVRDALAKFQGPVVYVANVMTQPGETDGLSVSGHLRAIADHAGPVVTDTLVHTGELPEDLVYRYEAEGAAPVIFDRKAVGSLGVRVHEADLLSEDLESGVRHDPARLAEEVCRIVVVRG